jgi:putative FmdB family regulatory protein
MPIYEYDCSACGERTEITASIAADPAAVTCSACGSREVRRHYGAVAIVGSRRAAPAPGELRAVDPGDMTRDLARRYARSTGDPAIAEISRRAEHGAGPDEVQEIVKEAKADRETRTRKGGAAT